MKTKQVEARVTFKEFFTQLPNDGSCLNHLFDTRFTQSYKCPKCKEETKWPRIKTERALSCQRCGHHLHSTVCTLFEDNRTSLLSWFYVKMVKNHLIRFALYLAVLALAPLARAQFTFTTNSGAITITGYNTAVGLNAIIPTSTNGYAVVNIAPNAFQNASITNLIIPDSVTNIGDAAFFDCTGLMSITIGDGVTTIGFGAFALCNNLTSITIPNSVTTIGDQEFFECSGLTNVTIGSSVTNIGYGVFENCSKLKNTIIPNNVTSLGNFAFAFCYSLTSVSIPDSVAAIGQSAFNSCSGLTNVTLGSGVTTIGSNAFESCIDLANIVIPSNLTNIQDDVFVQCLSLTNILVVTANPAYSSLDGVLFDKTQTTLIQYPIGLTNKNYAIPNSVTTIGDFAFGLCTNLTTVILPDGITNIGTSAFSSPLSKLATAYYFLGNPPTSGDNVFSGNISAVAYCLPSATGWGSTFDGIPVQLWNPQASTPKFIDNHFNFNITGPTNTALVLEGSSNLMTWISLGIYPLTNGATTSFMDSNQFPIFFYRFRSP